MSPKRALIAFFSLSLLAVSAPAYPELPEEPPLTNQAVVDMVDAGLPEDVIMAKIRASKCDFDTSSGALMELTKRGVRISLIKAMIEEDVHPSKQCEGEPAAGEAAKAAVVKLGVPGDMVFVRGGCFKMGDVFGMGNEDEKPAHEVCVDDFYIGRHEVTVGEFREFMLEEGGQKGVAGGNCYRHTGEKWTKDPSGKWDNAGFPQDDNHPVTCVSWDDAVEYARWKSVRDGRMYRLPTEAEWEYAARGGGNNYMYGWGNSYPSGNIADESARQNYASWFVWEGYEDGYVNTAPVGSFKSNDLGLYDITGNVWEWVSDWYLDAYYAGGPADNPQGPEAGTSKVLRGGSWFDVPADLRTTRRSWNTPARRTFYNGFRLAASAEQ